MKANIQNLHKVVSLATEHANHCRPTVALIEEKGRDKTTHRFSNNVRSNTGHYEMDDKMTINIIAAKKTGLTYPRGFLNSMMLAPRFQQTMHPLGPVNKYRELHRCFKLGRISFKFNFPIASAENFLFSCDAGEKSHRLFVDAVRRDPSTAIDIPV